MIILGIESSCDETAISIIRDKKEVLCNIVSTQIDTHRLYGGVVPEIASRMHIQNIGYVLDQAIKEANIELNDIDAIAVTKGPGLIGSLHVGMQCAKALALALEKPLIGVHHLAGHIYANQLVEDMEFPLMALVVSGGNSELVYMRDHLNFEIIGQTYDDAIGETYDKVGRLIDVPYPGGPQIDKLAKIGKPTYTLPRPLDDDTYNFSFSGLKSAVINLVHNTKQRGEEINKEDLACSFQEAALGVLVAKTIRAAKEYQVKQVIVAGGVSANSRLRADLKDACEKENIKLTVPPMKYCTDNAAMIAMAGSYMYEKGIFSDLHLNVSPSLELQ